jgi:hypothetical protein
LPAKRFATQDDRHVPAVKEKDGKLFDHLREVADMMPTDNSPPAGSS